MSRGERTSDKARTKSGEFEVKKVVVDVPTSAPKPPQQDTAHGMQSHIQVSRTQAREKIDSRLILLREPDSKRAASFRVLRHRLQKSGDPHVIAVTSAEAEEGKTTCAVNLALALGESNRARVLLVEANLRKPALAALFSIVPTECFAAQMTRHKERPLEPWSLMEVRPSLHVAPVQPGESRALIDAPAFALAIDSFKRAGYEYIVLDTPRVLGSADVNLIEDSADGVLFTVRAGRSSARSLKRAVEQLSPANILGVALLEI